MAVEEVLSKLPAADLAVDAGFMVLQPAAPSPVRHGAGSPPASVIALDLVPARGCQRSADVTTAPTLQFLACASVDDAPERLASPPVLVSANADSPLIAPASLWRNRGLMEVEFVWHV